MEYIYNVGSTDSAQYNHFRLELVLTEAAVSQIENTTTVFYRLRLYAGSHYFYGYGLGASIVINGQTVALRNRENEPAVSIEKNGHLDILQGEVTLLHNPDGTFTAPVEFSIEMTAGTYTPGNMAGTGELVLTPIARASTIRGTSANIGEVSMLAITRHSPEFTHSVKYTFGNQEGYISPSGEAVDTEAIFDALSIGFLLPESFYGEIPDAASGVCHLEITTYAGDTPIGKETTSITATASYALCAPELAFTAMDTNPDTLMVTDDAALWIRGHSRVRCTVDARGQKGAGIVSVLVNGSPETEFTAMSGLVEVTVTDSRGYTTRKQVTHRVIDYVELTCNASAHRLESTGEQVQLTVWGQYFAGNLGLYDNTLTVACTLPDGRYEYVECTVQDNAYSGQLLLDGLSYQDTHTLQIMAMDLLYYLTRTVTVNRGVPVFDWGQSDFTFHVPVLAQGGLNGVYMQGFSGTSVWFTPAKLPQSYLIAGGGVLGVLTANADGCTWQGTEGVVELSAENRAGALFSGDTQGVIVSNCPIE